MSPHESDRGYAMDSIRGVSLNRVASLLRLTPASTFSPCGQEIVRSRTATSCEASVDTAAEKSASHLLGLVYNLPKHAAHGFTHTQELLLSP